MGAAPRERRTRRRLPDDGIFPDDGILPDGIVCQTTAAL